MQNNKNYYLKTKICYGNNKNIFNSKNPTL